MPQNIPYTNITINSNNKFKKFKSMCHLRKTLTILIGLSIFLLYVMWSKGELVRHSYHTFIENDTLLVCKENNRDSRLYFPSQSKTLNSPIIYFVTPTYPRREQVAEITRLGQTLMHIENLHWIVADDNDFCNPVLWKLLNKFGIPFTHISSPMPDVYRTVPTVPRGVSNRRAAITWLKNNNIKSGVLYFGDDDNTFDLELFSEIRHTKRVSMFPVGLIGLYAISTPVVRDGKVIGFFDSWPANRKWPVDMAGFAVNLEFMSHNYANVTMPYKAGHEEDGFLKSIGLKLADIEPVAKNCTEILVWHTQTKKAKPPTIKISSAYLEKESSLVVLLHSLESMGVTHLNSNLGESARLSLNGKTRDISKKG